MVYEDFKPIQQPIGDYKVGIDIGLDELICIVSDNPKLKSFIVSGKEIKSFNQWFNKEKSKLQSEIDKLINSMKKGINIDIQKLENLKVKIKQLHAYRYRWIHNNFHKISRRLVNILHQTGHRIIYIGKNAIESKNGINLGSKTNQHFVSIPYRKLINLITYKARQLGIEVIEVDEAYTSKSSPFSDVITIQKTHNKTLCNGERKGNVFKDYIVNKVFHADLVGALNILRIGLKQKVLGFYENLKVVFIKLCNPTKLRLIDFIYKVSPGSLWIGSSRNNGWTEKVNHMIQFEIYD